jgi:hypothetical protein
MTRYTFVVLTNAVEGKDDEFNRWYTNEHLKDVLELPGFVGAQRFRFVPYREGASAPHRYLALYDVETDDLEATMAGLVEVAQTEKMPFSEAIDTSNLIGWYFEPITDHLTAADFED